jgi:hypothetical protein
MQLVGDTENASSMCTSMTASNFQLFSYLVLYIADAGYCEFLPSVVALAPGGHPSLRLKITC